MRKPSTIRTIPQGKKRAAASSKPVADGGAEVAALRRANLRLQNQLRAAREDLKSSSQELSHRNRELQFSDFSVNHAAVATFWVSAEGKICRVNDATCRMFGYTAQELLSMHKFQLRADGRLEEWGAHWRALRRSKSLDFESRFRRKSGQEFPAEVQSNFVEFEGTEYLFFFVRDITERKNAEESLHRLNGELEERVRERTSELELANAQLRESGKMFRALAETLPQLVWTCRPDGRCDYLSPQWISYTGIPEEPQLDYGWSEQVHPEDREMARQRWAAAAATGQPLDVEFRVRRGDGVYRWFKTRAMPLLDEQGRLVKWFGTNTDVDDLRRAEEQARASLAEKETLLKEIHHRVKNNMQLVSSLLQLQSDYITNPEALTVLREGQNRVRSMALIHEKLYRATSLAEIDFAEYSQSLVDILMPTYAVQPDVVSVEVDADVIQLSIETAIPLALILNELISNSLKHAFPDGRRGKIRVSLSAQDNQDVVLSVVDDGVGLPEGMDWTQSTSLGLHLVRILTGQIDGTMTLRQQDGVAFSLRFHEVRRSRAT